MKLRKRLIELTTKLESLELEKKRSDSELSLLNKKKEQKAEQNRAVVSSYRDKISSLERELVRRDGKIEVLEESKRTLQDTIKELKEEVKEYKQWIREQQGSRGSGGRNTKVPQEPDTSH